MNFLTNQGRSAPHKNTRLVLFRLVVVLPRLLGKGMILAKKQPVSIPKEKLETKLVGGFKPSEKYAPQMGNLPQGSG